MGWFDKPVPPGPSTPPYRNRKQRSPGAMPPGGPPTGPQQAVPANPYRQQDSGSPQRSVSAQQLGATAAPGISSDVTLAASAAKAAPPGAAPQAAPDPSMGDWAPSSGSGNFNEVPVGRARQGTHGLNPGIPTNRELLQYYGSSYGAFGDRGAMPNGKPRNPLSEAHDAVNSDLWDKLPPAEKERWARQLGSVSPRK